MFGYVKPLREELKVREMETYRALYCGLCRSMKRHTGLASTVTLRYDFVFLVLVRLQFSDSALSFRKRRCLAHPLRRRPMADDTPQLAYAAAVSAVLAELKLLDDIADERAFKRLFARFLVPAVGRMRRRGGAAEELRTSMADALLRLSEKEKLASDSLDEMADCFGDLLGEVFAWGFSGSDARVAREIGRVTGRFIYVMDAADDVAEDKKRARYNPLLCRYGDEAMEIGEDRKIRLSPKIAEELYTAVLLDLGRLEAAVKLLPRSAGDTAAILLNIIYLGMPAEARRVLFTLDKTTKEIFDE